MRMWMVEPQYMCDQHVLGEHRECHMLFGAVTRKQDLYGYIVGGLVEVQNLPSRHAALAAEMHKRGFMDATPLFFDKDYDLSKKDLGKVDVKDSEDDLFGRCIKCRQRRENIAGPLERPVKETLSRSSRW